MLPLLVAVLVQDKAQKNFSGFSAGLSSAGPYWDGTCHSPGSIPHLGEGSVLGKARRGQRCW